MNVIDAPELDGHLKLERAAKIPLFVSHHNERREMKCRHLERSDLQGGPLRHGMSCPQETFTQWLGPPLSVLARLMTHRWTKMQ